MKTNNNSPSSGQELHHEIFGSTLDRAEMTPYLLLKTEDYETALIQATRMMGNRGFDTFDNNELHDSEKRRAQKYIEQVHKYFTHSMFPFVKNHLQSLAQLHSESSGLYRDCLKNIGEIEATLSSREFRTIVDDDPRNVLLLASSKKYPHIFHGYHGKEMDIPSQWQQMACSILKMAHLIKSIEEDSQDINDYAQLGLFLEIEGQRLNDLYSYDWHNPAHLPKSEPARRAFVKVSTFFHKLGDSVTFDAHKNCLVFKSGDGVDVDIVQIKSRLKSPESMFTKLGKDVEGEVRNIRDILAITFILKNKNDTLKLFHALQKRGVILQENTLSSSITQTLFDNAESMAEAVRSLIISLSRSEGSNAGPAEDEVLTHAGNFYKSLSINTAKNPHSSLGHKKFQCKINFCVPIHRKADTSEIIIPGTPDYTKRHEMNKNTEQHTLALELRISDEESWSSSEYRGDSHHDAYKFRQLVAVMNRVFKIFFISRKNALPSCGRTRRNCFRS